jgi:hypothetical protein
MAETPREDPRVYSLQTLGSSPKLHSGFIQWPSSNGNMEVALEFDIVADSQIASGTGTRIYRVAEMEVSVAGCRGIMNDDHG